MNKSKHYIIFALIIVVLLGFVYFYGIQTESQLPSANLNQPQTSVQDINTQESQLAIASMRQKNYPGSNLIIEQKLSPGSNYARFIASYRSDGLKIYGLLTVPEGQKPVGGWPVIIFNHGYIQPDLYRTAERYVAYVDAFAKGGYIVFKPDYRGNGNSEGEPDSAYYSPGYASDVLNALATLKHYPDANHSKIGMWGHSMGGNITLRAIVVDTQDIKAAVIWGGVVGSYNDLINNWQNKVKYNPPARDLALRNNHRQDFINRYGTPASNPGFWQSIDPTYFLSDIAAPIQLHTGGNDEEVPVAFSVGLQYKLAQAGKTVEYYNYPGGDHNISSPNFELAMRRSLTFFDKYLK